MYSKTWNPVKATAKIKVMIRPKMASRRLPTTMAWCAQVHENPEVNRMTVFSKGTSHADNTSIPFGGHTVPISTVGAMLEWKNAQKKAKKNKKVRIEEPMSDVEVSDVEADETE